LQERWPHAFPWDFQQRKPLALGIHQAVALHFPETPVWRIKQAIALFQYGGKGAYLHAVMKGGPRYDLDGQPNGEVTATEQEQAKRDLEAVLARRTAKRQTQQHAVTAPRRAEEGSSIAQAEGEHEQLRQQES
jgi:sRNA-binding protein